MTPLSNISFRVGERDRSRTPQGPVTEATQALTKQFNDSLSPTKKRQLTILLVS